jgi:hypothetical protein
MNSTQADIPNPNKRLMQMVQHVEAAKCHLQSLLGCWEDEGLLYQDLEDAILCIAALANRIYEKGTDFQAPLECVDDILEP